MFFNLNTLFITFILCLHCVFNLNTLFITFILCLHCIFNLNTFFISFILCLHLYSFIHDHACWRFISPFIGVCCQYLFQSRYIQLSFLELFFLNIIQLFTFQAFSQWRCVQRFLPWALFAMRTHTSGKLRIRYDMLSNVKVGRELYLCESSFGRFSFIWYTNLEKRNVLQKITV